MQPKLLNGLQKYAKIALVDQFQKRCEIFFCIVLKLAEAS